MLTTVIKSKYTGRYFELQNVAEYRREIQHLKAKQRAAERKERREKEYNELLHYPRRAATSLRDLAEKLLHTANKLNSEGYLREFVPEYNCNCTLLKVQIQPQKLCKFYDPYSVPIGQKILGSISPAQERLNEQIGWITWISFVFSVEKPYTYERDSFFDFCCHGFPGINIRTDNAYYKEELDEETGEIIQTVKIMHNEARLYCDDFPNMMYSGREYKMWRI